MNSKNQTVQCTIAGNRTEQSLTKGAVCRPSRHRLSNEVFPATHRTVTQHAARRNPRPCREEPSSGDNALYTNVQRGGERVVLGDTEPHAVNTWSARGRANSSSNHRKPLMNQGTTLRRWCVYGARGARLTHSQTATPESKPSSRQQTG